MVVEDVAQHIEQDDSHCVIDHALAEHNCKKLRVFVGLNHCEGGHGVRSTDSGTVLDDKGGAEDDIGVDITPLADPV